MNSANLMSDRPPRRWGQRAHLVWIAIAAVLCPSFRPAGQVPAVGEISGRISYQALGIFLEGARVEVVGTNRSVLTDRDGHFRLAEVRAGATTLMVSYMGLNSQNVVLDVKPAQVVARDIGLISDVYVMEAFKVARLRDGHAAQGRATGSRRSGQSIANVRPVHTRTPRRSSCLRP